MVLHYLASWGAPPALLAAMQPPEGRPFAEARSRPLLLALGWLAAAAGLFERPIRDREPQPDVRALLPPYPEVGQEVFLKGAGCKPLHGDGFRRACCCWRRPSDRVKLSTLGNQVTDCDGTARRVMCPSSGLVLQ